MGKCEAELISHVNRESTLLRNLAMILHSVRKDLQKSNQKSREWPTPELQNSLTPSVTEVWVVQFKQHAGNQRGNNPTLGHSLKKVLHAYGL